MKALPPTQTDIVPHGQGQGSPDGAYASEARQLRDLLAEYEARADKALDWQPERKLEPGETKVDAVFRMVDRLKDELVESRRRLLGWRQENEKLRAKVEPLTRRVVQLEGLVQGSTERAVEMIAPENAKATAAQIRATLGEIEHAESILDGAGIGRYHRTTGRPLSVVERIEAFVNQAGMVAGLVDGEGEEVEAIDPDDVVIVEMPGGEE